MQPADIGVKGKISKDAACGAAYRGAEPVAWLRRRHAAESRRGLCGFLSAIGRPVCEDSVIKGPRGRG